MEYCFQNYAPTDRCLLLAIIFSQWSFLQQVYPRESPLSELELDMKTLTKRIIIQLVKVLIVAAITFIVGCGEVESEIETPPGRDFLQELSGTAWSLLTIGDDGIASDSIVTIYFDDETASGLAGCNGYSASYSTGDDKISFEYVERANASCQLELMEIEENFIETLTLSSSYNVEAFELVLFDNSGETALTFFAYELQPLQDTRWSLVDFHDSRGTLVPLLPETTITLEFSEDGLLSGSAGCNGYSASYDAASGVINIAAMVMTEIYCMEPEGLMDQETAYLTALSKAASYTIVEDTLALQDEDGALLMRLTPQS